MNKWVDGWTGHRFTLVHLEQKDCNSFLLSWAHLPPFWDVMEMEPFMIHPHISFHDQNLDHLVYPKLLNVTWDWISSGSIGWLDYPGQQNNNHDGQKKEFIYPLFLLFFQITM